MLDLQNSQHVLVIKLRYLGDVLLMTPCVQSLGDNLPDTRITVVVNHGTEDILKHHPDVHEVLVVDRSRWGAVGELLLALRRRRFDCVIDLTDGDRSAILTRLSRADYRVGYNSERRWRGRLYHRIIDADPSSMHTVQYHLKAIEQLGLAVTSSTPTLVTGPDDDRYAADVLARLNVESTTRLVMIHPGARWEAKSWPTNRFAAVADAIQATGCARVLLVGSRLEEERIADILRHMTTEPCVLIGRTTVLQLAAIMKRCDVFIGNDNGPMHMAAAVGLPVVGLFGPTDPKIWGPCGSGHRTFFKHVDCRECFTHGCRLGDQSCMNRISVDEVIEAVGEMLGRSDARRQSHRGAYRS